MPGKLIGGKQPPWVFVVLPEHIEDDAEGALRQVLSRHFTRIDFVSTHEVQSIHQGEFDAAIVVGGAAGQLSSHLHVIQFSDEAPAVSFASTGAPVNNAEWSRWALHWLTGQTAKQFTVSQDAIDDGLLALAEATLVPPEGDRYHYLDWQLINGSGSAEPPAHTKLTPLLVDSADRVLAARLQRGESTDAGELWCLPANAANDVEGWVAAALRRWRRAGHAAFTDVAAWTEDPEWTTHEEDVLSSTYEARQREVEALQAQLAAELEELDRRREAARINADSQERRLLTSQSGDLVDAVRAVFERVGFQVVDSDSLPQHEKGRKQEDLRISEPGWVCLTEVKGYARSGAKTSDLLQLEKAAKVYILNEKKEPDARWYVVNQAFETSPADRPEPFASAREEVEFFGNDRGLVIDTRDLFRLDKAVQQGALQPAEARKLLRAARGVFHYPPRADST